MSGLDFMNNIDLSQVGDVLDIFRGEKNKLKTNVINDNLLKLGDEIEKSETALGVVDKMNTLLADSEFKEKFSDADMFKKKKWPEKFEIFNKRISLLLSSYLDGMIENYPQSFKTEIVVGMEFALIKKLWEAWKEEASDLFSYFARKDADIDKDVKKKRVLKNLFTGFWKSTAFMGLGKRFMNLTKFFQDYEDELSNTKHIRSPFVAKLLEDDFFDSRNNWYDTTTEKNKTFDQLKYMDDFPDTLDPDTAEVFDDAAAAKKEQEMVKDIADSDAVLEAMDKKVIKSLIWGKWNGWALSFASKFLSSRDTWKSFIWNSFGVFSKITDNALGKFLLGGKTLTQAADAKTWLVADFVLKLVGFEWGRNGVQSYLDAEKNITNADTNSDTNNETWSNTTRNKVTFDGTNDTFVAYAAEQIYITESAWKYDAVNEYDVNGVSLGKCQRHGYFARDMMIYIRDKSKKDGVFPSFASLMGPEFISLMDKGVKDEGNIWLGPKKTEFGYERSNANRADNHTKRITNYKSLMSRPQFQWYMDDYMKFYVKKALISAKKEGITGPAVAVYYARLYNWWTAMAPKFLKDAWGADATLETLHQTTLKKRANDPYNALNKIYIPLYEELKNKKFPNVKLDQL